MTEAIDARGLKAALLKGAEYLYLNQRILDNLNVFPVPDGDTGANMVATLQAGIRTLGESTVTSIGDISRCMKDELLRNSRGNSGFIIAWFFSGFFNVAERYEYLTKDSLLEGFSNGAYQVNSSLFTPVEGTMITIIASMTKALRECPGLDPETCLRQALYAGRESLFETPRLLPLLAKAGVVDSGALGFIFIMEGILRGFSNQAVAVELEETYRFKPDPAAFRDWVPLPEYRYCTEVYVIALKASGENLGRFLQEKGNSIALVIDPGFIKLHIHTNDPHEILHHLEGFGTIEKSKIEDMHEQIGILATNNRQDASCSILACVPGPGFVAILEDLGVGRCLVYGTELPSAGALLEALSMVDAEAVIVLPNNSNILPAALLARDLSGRDVSILPTRNIIEGIAACYGYSENETMRENLSGMKECMNLVDSLLVYQSGTDSTFGERFIPSGYYFVIHGNDLASSGASLPETVSIALVSAGTAQKCNASVYTGKEFDNSLLSTVVRLIKEANPDLEVETHEGGQPRELLIISLE
jgi:DAK2 domain fusion protein YloV